MHSTQEYKPAVNTTYLGAVVSLEARAADAAPVRALSVLPAVPGAGSPPPAVVSGEARQAEAASVHAAALGAAGVGAGGLAAVGPRPAGLAHAAAALGAVVAVVTAVRLGAHLACTGPTTPRGSLRNSVVTVTLKKYSVTDY